MKTVVFIVRKPVIVTAGYYTSFATEELPKLVRNSRNFYR